MGITYNQPGVTYDDARYTYDGTSLLPPVSDPCYLARLSRRAYQARRARREFVVRSVCKAG